jgi:uncharacterized protein with HEPN domain
MIDAIDAATRFLIGRGRQDLESDLLLQFALVRAVEIVGEAASKVSPLGRHELSSVPWNRIIGMRNRIVHAYFDVDLNILWDTLTQALPPLRLQLKAAAEAPG